MPRREAINAPAGPVHAGEPRPDASINAFCLDCHHAEGKGGRGLDALSYDGSTVAEHDRRRQPLQPPRRVFGYIPAGWIPSGPGPGGPDQAMQASPEGLLIDAWVLPEAPMGFPHLQAPARATTYPPAGALMGELTAEPPLLRRLLAAAFEAVRAADGVDPDRVGAIGFCFGDLCAILLARMGLPLRGVVSFHGLLKIGEPLDAAVQARLLVQHGQDDPMAPPSDLGALAAEMKRVDADWELHAYAGVLHAFTNPKADDLDFGRVYDGEADRRSWGTMRRFLAAEGAEQGFCDVRRWRRCGQLALGVCS